MKKVYFLVSFMSLIGFQSLMAQSPASFNYQAVPRRQDSLLYNTGQVLRFRFQIREDFASGNLVFAETNNLSVNRQGAVNTAIGTGSPISGTPHDLLALNWGAHNYFLSVSVDVNNNNSFEANENFGVTQLLSVPYAMYAAKSGSGGAGAQTLSVSGNTLSISNGNSVNLPFEQYQAGDGVYLVGQSINAYDESPSNELQSLSISGNQLTISQGNTVSLPSGGGAFSLPYAGQTSTNNAAFQVTNNGNGPDIRVGAGAGGELQFGGSINWSIVNSGNNLDVRNPNNAISAISLNDEHTTINAEQVSLRSTNGHSIEFFSDQPGMDMYYGNQYVGITPNGPNAAPRTYMQGPIMSLVMDAGTGSYAYYAGDAQWDTHVDAGGNYFIWSVENPSLNYTGGALDIAPGSSIHTFEPYNAGDASLGRSSYPFNSAYIYSVINPSDRRLKDQIRPIEKAMDKVMKMEPVDYLWKNKKNGEGRQLGFIAQDLEKVIPEAVRHESLTEKELADIKQSGKSLPEIADPYGVNYIMLIPVLTKALQEQQSQIDALKQQNEALLKKMSLFEQKSN